MSIDRLRFYIWSFLVRITRGNDGIASGVIRVTPGRIVVVVPVVSVFYMMPKVAAMLAMSKMAAMFTVTEVAMMSVA